MNNISIKDPYIRKLFDPSVKKEKSTEEITLSALIILICLKEPVFLTPPAWMIDVKTSEKRMNQMNTRTFNLTSQKYIDGF